MDVVSMTQTLQLGDMQVDGPSLAEVCRRYGVRELSLFGSAVRGEMRPESDIDIMVEFEPGIRVGLIKFELLVEELESLTGRRVDLVTKRELKPCAGRFSKTRASSMRHGPSFLKDILSACRKIEAIVAATSEDSFLKDEVLPRGRPSSPDGDRRGDNSSGSVSSFL
jgi:predicted nucleotidyltransferase